MRATDAASTTMPIPPVESDEQAAFRAEVRAMLVANAQPRREVSPWAVNFDRDKKAALAAFEKGCAWQHTLFDNHLAGLTYPVEYGGRGGSHWHERIYAEESARFDVSSRFVGATIAMLGPTLLQHGTEAQKAHYLPKLLSAEYAFCQLFSEPGAGSDLAGLACRAVRDGDEFVVTGQKVWNSAAQFCNWGMLLVRTAPDAPKHRGVTFLLVEMSTPGFDVRPLVQATGASEFNEVFLNEVRVPVAHVVGAINEGWTVARSVLSNESSFIGGGAGSGGTFRRLAMLAERHARSHEPAIRQDLARVYTRERILKMMGQRLQVAARRRETSTLDPSMLKLYVAENRVHTGNLAAALAGPAGVASDDGDEVSEWVRAELLGRYLISIGGGTNEVQRNNLAERALGLPKEMRNDHELAWKDVPRN